MRRIPRLCVVVAALSVLTACHGNLDVPTSPTPDESSPPELETPEWTTPTTTPAPVGPTDVVTSPLPSQTPVSTPATPAGTPPAPTPPAGIDADGDGYPVGEDCDDDDPTVYPGALEVLDGKDNDCNDEIDEIDGVDADNDGYFAAPIGTDCDDGDSAVYPGATEQCNGTDDDCDGDTDEDAGPLWYADVDNDGFGNPNDAIQACTQPAGRVPEDVATDCRDTNDNVYPGATEVCNEIDDDCDGYEDEGATSTYYLDADGDGFGVATTTTDACKAPEGYVSNALDCDDSASSVFPGAPEACNGVDDNCDGTVDEGAQTTFYIDADGDGFGDVSQSVKACDAPDGFVADATDCRDDDATIHPGAQEACNGVDDNCSGEVDEGALTTWYLDADGDGHGSASTSTKACSAPPGYVALGDDCDDTNPGINPSAREVCDASDTDENCNGLADDADSTVESGTESTFYEDRDGDGYGDAAASGTFCDIPTGYVSDHTDCDDTNPTVNPGAHEQCNGIDDNCDGTIDEGVLEVWYRDNDQDGFGTDTDSMQSCSAPSGYTAADGDCDDTNPAVNPGASEQCNGIDDDCDGTVDEDGTNVFYEDLDGDGFGNTESTTQACDAPAGYVSTGGDCDDNDATTNPDAEEVCNGVDDNCDGHIDEGLRTAWYQDFDGDGYGASGTAILTCSPPPSYADNDQDCDDTNAAIHPGAPELCNNVDDDCNGLIDDNATSSYTWSTTTYTLQTASSEFGNNGPGMWAAWQSATSGDDCLALEVTDECRVVAKGFDATRSICIVWALKVDGEEPTWGDEWVSVGMRNNCGTPSRPIGCVHDNASGDGYVSQACADDYLYDGTTCPTDNDIVWKRVQK